MTDQLTQLKEIVIRSIDVHNKIAAELWPNGVTATCNKCGTVLTLTLEDTARCFAAGWPKCCGHSTTIASVPA